MQRDVTEQVFRGTWPDRSDPPFSEVVPADRVNLQTFKYVTHLVRGSTGAALHCAALRYAVGPVLCCALLSVLCVAMPGCDMLL